MRYITALLAFSCLAMAQDKPAEKPTEKKKAEKNAEKKDPEPRIVTEAEWAAIEKKARDPKLTTLRQHERVIAAAQNIRVAVQGRLLDIKPNRTGASLVVCSVRSGRHLMTFHLRKADVPSVGSWSKWDRISWVSRIRVAHDGRVQLDPVYEALTDLKRTSNPGPMLPSFDKAPEWDFVGKRFSTLRKKTPEAAFAYMRKFHGKAFAFPATVRSKEDSRVWCEFDRIIEHTSDRPKRSDILVADPQLRSMLRVGDRVVVAGVLDSGTKGWSLQFRIWKLLKKPKKKE